MKCEKSIALSLFALNLISLDATAGELVLDQNLLEKTSIQARSKPYRIQQSIVSRGISVFELGNPATPYFQDQVSKTVKRRFRSSKNCYEVSFLETLNLATRSDCRQLMSDLKLPGLPEFHAVKVSDGLNSSPRGFEFWNTSDSYRLKGFVHTRESIQMDQRILGLKDTSAFPTQSFQVKTETAGTVVIDPQFGLKITQQASVQAGKIGIQDSSGETIANTIHRKLNDWVFTDGRRVVVINDLLLPRPFQDSLLTIHPKFSQYLSDLENRSGNRAVCYRDSWMGESDQDCHQMAIRKIKPLQFIAFKLLMIDFQEATVNPIH
jgi:hypothetical protein